MAFIDQDLLRQIEQFRAANGDMSVTNFGLYAVNDRSLVQGLLNGREFRRETRLRIEAVLNGEPNEDQINRAASLKLTLTFPKAVALPENQSGEAAA